MENTRDNISEEAAVNTEAAIRAQAVNSEAAAANADAAVNTETAQADGIENAFKQLEEILSKMDADKVTLEESFRLYERGMKLIKYCNETIDTVEKKVRILSTGGETDEF